MVYLYLITSFAGLVLMGVCLYNLGGLVVKRKQLNRLKQAMDGVTRHDELELRLFDIIFDQPFGRMAYDLESNKAKREVAKKNNQS